MGTWGVYSFENDWAMEWIGDLRQSGDASPVRATLARVVDHGGTRRPTGIGKLFGRRTDWLKAVTASQALAAAELVAVWLGHPAPNLPEGVTQWLSTREFSSEAGLTSLARQAVNIVKNNSELKDLWEEGNASEWRSAVEDLERRLQP